MGNDLGGSDRLSEGQRQLIRRAATLSIMSESVEADFIRNLAFDSEAYGVLCDRLGRCLQRLGLERVSRDVTPIVAELPTGKGGAMTKGIPKKRQRDEQLRKKRLQAAPALAKRRPKRLLKAIPSAAQCRRSPAVLGKRQFRGLTMNILAALDDRNLLGASIRDRGLMEALAGVAGGSFGLPLSSDELALYRASARGALCRLARLPRTFGSSLAGAAASPLPWR